MVASCWYFYKIYIMMHGSMNIKYINILPVQDVVRGLSENVCRKLKLWYCFTERFSV